MTASTDRILPGVALMLGFCLFAPLIDVSSKLATQTVPVGQVTLARFIVQTVLMLPILVLLGQGVRMTARAFRLTLWRALASIAATFTFVWAVSHMPIADALAIAFVEPFILLIFGKLMFNDEVGPRRIAASGVGFIGALMVIQPSFATFGWVALLPVGTAFAFAAYMLITREASRHMTPEAMQFHTAWVAALICLPMVALAEGSGIVTLDPVMPEGWAWAWLLGVGVAATVSHMFMTYALKLAPSATLAPLHYLEIVSAATLAYLVFGDFPNAWTWTGIGVIVASGLYIIHRERVTAAQARATRRQAGSAAG
ncbi:MAG: DMT family transporter [Rhodobacterales bacterium]|nr:DMT family transporter [Rhodobacterales bacterium]MDX5500773.1 DMT family transporter [Rhodobacterales bacterium]